MATVESPSRDQPPGDGQPRAEAPPRFNLPNAVTIGRFGLVPLVTWGMVKARRRGGSPALAAGLFMLAAASDVLDGHLARSRDSETDFGRVVDPLADKALIAGALWVLVRQGRLPAWPALAIVAREAAVTGLRFVVGRRGVVVPASRLGKRKTTIQIAAVTALILAPDPRSAPARGLVYGAVALTVASGIEYFANLREGSSEGGG
jgi:CDP-diacylglycerol--glycerol-3-phosphate 3-phosphatidyltransferase